MSSARVGGQLIHLSAAVQQQPGLAVEGREGRPLEAGFGRSDVRALVLQKVWFVW